VLSVVSAWEIALKPELGIADVARWFRQAARNLQARILPVRLEHIAALEKLPLLHRDPFDRLLIAQAAAGQLALVTADDAIRSYREAQCVWD
jgi:PIN domain nuclease of toxin-antitoxin system